MKLLRSGVPFILLISTFILLMSVPIWIKASRFCYDYYDLGIYSQGLSQLRWGSWNPWLSGRQIALFADHFDPILLLAAPIARQFRMPFGALLAEDCFVVAAILPLGWLVRRGELAPSGGLLLGALLLFNRATLNAVDFPVHPTTWALFPWMWVIAALKRSQWLSRASGLVAGLVLLFACKEEFPFVGVVLGSLMMVRKRVRDGLSVLVLSLLWIAFAFWLRPHWVGPTHDYASGLFHGITQHPLRLVIQHLSSLDLWGTTLLTVLPFTPLVVWCAKEKLRPDFLPFALLLPPLAIRFLANAWLYHYGSVIASGLVGGMVFWIGTRKVPRRVSFAAVALLIMTNGLQIRRTVRAISSQFTQDLSDACSAEPRRLLALRESLAVMRSAPGPLLLESNLMPPLAERSDIYMLFGPGTHRTFRAVLVEKPPQGSPWPLSLEALNNKIISWRADPKIHVLRDDPSVFMAEGNISP